MPLRDYFIVIERIPGPNGIQRRGITVRETFANAFVILSALEQTAENFEEYVIEKVQVEENNG